MLGICRADQFVILCAAVVGYALVLLHAFLEVWNRPKWSREVPEENGFYWVRTHGGIASIAFIRHSHDIYTDLYFCGESCPSVEVTQDWIATQDAEFLHKRLTINSL